MTAPPIADTVSALSTSRRRPRIVALSKRPSSALTVVMLGVVVYFLIPLLWLAISSTKTPSGLHDSFGLWFAHDGIHIFKNVQDVFAYQHGVFGTWLLNTVLYAGVSSVGAALLATAGGYGFAKYAFRGKEGIFALILGSIMVPTTALAIPTYLLFAKLHLVDTRWAIILPSLISPFGIYLMRVYAAEAIPDELIEAARIDGASEFRIFWRVSFRQLTPGFVTVLLFTLVATWNNYFLPLIMLNNPRLFPVTVGLATWNADANSGNGQTPITFVLVGALVAIVPLIIIFLVLQRYWQSGLGTGSVKG